MVLIGDQFYECLECTDFIGSRHMPDIIVFHSEIKNSEGRFVTVRSCPYCGGKIGLCEESDVKTKGRDSNKGSAKGCQ
jgi:hypothetical protein